MSARCGNRAGLALAVCVVWGLSATQAVAAPVYQLIDLGTLDSRSIGFSFGNAVNNAGQVTGYSSTTPGPDNAFLYQSGTITSLGTLPPQGAGTLNSSVGLAINASGQVAGYSTVQNQLGPYHAALFSNGTVTDLGTLGGTTSQANGINNAAKVVGNANTAQGTAHAFLFAGGMMQDLGTLGAFGGIAISGAQAINNHDQVVGSSTTSTSAAHAFRYDSGSGLLDLGTLTGYDQSRAFAINDFGQVVGYSSNASAPLTDEAFLYDATGIHDLGVAGIATGINNLGQIVGNRGGVNTEFLISGGQVYDISSLITNLDGYGLTGVDGINDNGQIVGSAFINGNQHAILLNLVPQSVPEPSSLTLLGLGVLGLIGYGRWRGRN